MARESLQYMLINAALNGITDAHTVRVYKKDIKRFVEWAKEHGYTGLASLLRRGGKGNGDSWKETPEYRKIRDVVQEYADAIKYGYSPSTVHRYLAPICKGFGINMKEIDKEKRTAGHLSRSRNPFTNRQGKAERMDERFSHLVKAQEAIGIRRAELGRLAGGDLFRDENGYLCVHVRKGKGGKEQLQRILPQHERTVMQLFKGLDSNEKVFAPGELSNKIDLHGIRAEVAREAYDYYLARLQTEPGYREQLIRELEDRWTQLHPHHKESEAGKDRKYRDFVESCSKTSPYMLRGENKFRAEDKHQPVAYDRLALMAVSVFHLSHWRLDVTVTNYMIM